MNDELELAEHLAEKARRVAVNAHMRAARAQTKALFVTERLNLLRKKSEKEAELNFVLSQIESLDNSTLAKARPSDKPVLALPRLLPDHSDVDPTFRDHLRPQTEQIVHIFKTLSSKDKPYVRSLDIKKYIENNFQIENPDYWKSKTHPREPVRWWKAVYDKAIERLDLKLGLIARSDITGKKGLYALKEYLPEQMPLLFEK